MPQKRYKVIFTGKFAEGANPEKSLARIAAMFKVSPKKVRLAFGKGADAVIISTDDKAQAERYVRGMGKAGAICKVEADSQVNSPHPGHPKKKQASSPGEGSKNARTVELSIGTTDVTLTTLVCPRLTSLDNLLVLNRKDCDKVAFNEISLATVYKDEDNAADYRLLFFLRTNKRPFGVQCTTIAFGDFPGVSGPTLLASLRNFLTFLYARNPEIIFDQNTYEFVAGSPIPLYIKEELQLATALYRAMPEELRGKSSGEAGYGVAQAPPQTPQTPQTPVTLKTPETQADAAGEASSAKEAGSTKGLCPKCGIKREPRKRECPRCGLVFVKWNKKKKRSTINTQEATDPITAWTSRFAAMASIMLLTGLILPLPGGLASFGNRQMLMPWHLFGAGKSAASLHLPQSASAPLYFATAVLLIVIISGGMRFLRSPLAKHLSWLIAGIASNALVLIVFRAEGFVLGLIFWPQTTISGLVWAGGILMGTLMVCLNHIRTFYSDPLKLPTNTGKLRLLQALCSTTLLALSITVFFAGSSLFSTWPIRTITMLLIIFSALSLYSGLNEPPVFTRPMSLYARALLILLPVMGTVAQHYLPYDPSALLIIPKGLLHASISNTKAMLLLTGSAMLFGSGFIGLVMKKLPAPMRRPTGALNPDDVQQGL